MSRTIVCEISYSWPRVSYLTYIETQKQTLSTAHTPGFPHDCSQIKTTRAHTRQKYVTTELTKHSEHTSEAISDYRLGWSRGLARLSSPSSKSACAAACIQRPK